MQYIAPKFGQKSFHCPLCGTFSHVTWERLSDEKNYVTDIVKASCSCCEKASIWRGTSFSGFSVSDGVMVYPDVSLAPQPELDMPDDVKIDYLEAASIFSRSPRAAAALLRLGLQKLCKHLGEAGENINKDIRSLAEKNVIPPLVVKVADTVRIAGNNAVHPGEMSEDDFDQVASKMFELLNFIVKKGISEPRELAALYELTPEGLRKSAEETDRRAREKNA
ncbi:DUF4145 domain-containing protein [Vibrio parahaemolyticus]|uniref:DUF4145 domain-containing protein n=1 Tax=Vibrio parahaemolyticus TaxID=670 RepID=UPI000993B218|nr:DUF4145 domain-containing protein [Vibrio parahaemolyticus]OOQ67394.1 hypothetical protein BSR61_24625 [Vibrio parahaemolyticus]PMT73809.1 DUF4145 domain-containing protein [Vibrio parahaemolyticus]PMT78990.1 DUF4145 domain-containing protein [Vibrio parahaemolyticus]